VYAAVPTTPNLFPKRILLVVVVVPSNNLPEESTLNASLPLVSTVNVSAAGNLIAVFVSPV